MILFRLRVLHTILSVVLIEMSHLLHISWVVMWIFFNKLFHTKKNSLLVPDQNWTTRTVTIFKADFSSSESLSAVRNTVGSIYMCQISTVGSLYMCKISTVGSLYMCQISTVGSIYMCQISMDFDVIVSQFHLCEYRETKLLSFRIPFFFQEQLMTPYF